MKTISLTNSERLVFVDDEDYERVSLIKWRLHVREVGERYLKRSSETIVDAAGTGIVLSRFILSYTGNLLIDHKDCDTFNNQKFNLREATRQQNSQNRGKQSNNTSGYKGVSYDRFRQKYTARIKVGSIYKNLGYFADKILAAIAYDDAAIIYHGEFAKLNFSLYGA